jgi:hypothetical protein
MRKYAKILQVLIFVVNFWFSYNLRERLLLPLLRGYTRVMYGYTQTTDWRNGPNTRLLRKRSRVRFTHSTNICVHEHVCLVWALSMYIMYVFTKKKYISMYIYPLSRIHNTSLISAYCGLDKRDSECLEYMLY